MKLGFRLGVDCFHAGARGRRGWGSRVGLVDEVGSVILDGGLAAVEAEGKRVGVALEEDLFGF